MLVLDKGSVELIDSMGNDLSIVNAARVSFNRDLAMKFNEKDIKLIKYMLEHKHTSPFEHVTITVRIKCPLFVRSQIMRHRTFSYNEISRRYTSEDIDFYIPTELRKQADNNRQASTDELVTHLLNENDYRYGQPDETVRNYLERVSLLAFTTYNHLLNSGVAREQARMVLPQNMYTTFYMTGNLHNWFHFLELRNTSEAQYETRLYAETIEDIIKDIVPNTYTCWRELS